LVGIRPDIAGCESCSASFVDYADLGIDEKIAISSFFSEFIDHHPTGEYFGRSATRNHGSLTGSHQQQEGFPMRLRPTSLCSVSISAIAIALLSSAAALAQTAPAADDGTAIEEIVVTSRRASERLQDVPLAISSQSSALLAERGVADLQGVSRYTPGLQFKDYVTTFNGSATLRGLAQSNVQNAVGNVGVFIDGVYLQRGYMVNTSLGDWDRIEVVKGPQSALYGANTFSGAINYVTKTPTNTFSGNLLATAGTADKSAQVAVGGPIIDGVLAGRLFVAKSSYDGTWNNNLPGVSGKNKKFGASERDAWSGALKFTPTDKLTVNGYYSEVNRTEYLRPYYEVDVTFVEDRTNCGVPSAVNPQGSMFCGTLPVSPASLRSGVGSPPSGLFASEQPPAVSSTKLIKISADYQLSEAFGLHYLFGSARGQAMEDFSFFSNTYNPTGRATISQQHEGGKLAYSSHDLRLSFEPADSPFKGDIGYFHSEAKDQFLFGIRLVAPGVSMTRLSTNPLSRTGIIAYNRSDANYGVDAVFARGSLRFLDDRATLSAEGRYSKTDVSFDDILGRAAVPSRPILTNSFKDFTPRVTAEYKLTSVNMVYASAAKGVKAGGFNGYVAGSVTLVPEEQTFDQESNWTYELGSKNTFLGGSAVLNASAYYVDWTNKQQGSTPTGYDINNVALGATPPSIYRSIGNATAYGVEVDGMWRPIHQLQLTGSASWTHARYADGSISPNYAGVCDNVVCPRTGGHQRQATRGLAQLQRGLGRPVQGRADRRLELLRWPRCDLPEQAVPRPDEPGEHRGLHLGRWPPWPR
jgi:iron complex outermembrane receptor protein